MEQRLAELDGWDLEGHAIVKQFKRGDFSGAVALVNAIEPVANELTHHPDVSISWETVTVMVTTHSEGGLVGPSGRSYFEGDRRSSGERAT